MIKNHANVIMITYESCLNFFEERKLSNHCFELEKSQIERNKIVQKLRIMRMFIGSVLITLKSC